MPITQILHISHFKTIMQPICIFVCRGLAVGVSKITHPNWCNNRNQHLQPSVLKTKMMALSSRPHFSFVIITSYGNQITPAKHEDNLEIKVWNSDESQADHAFIRVVQSENILLYFLHRGHDDDGRSCNHRAVSPSAMCRYICWLKAPHRVHSPKVSQCSIIT